MAHHIPFVATASVANLSDLESKITRAVAMHGARYVHVHSPCPLGWGTESHQTILIARLAVQSGLFPLFEARDGEVVDRTRMAPRVPVEDYLELQKRFRHLFQPKRNEEGLAAYQAIADNNIRRFGL
jgi:pyruvate ferredoxin oxidoreductase beta subunit